MSRLKALTFYVGTIEFPECDGIKTHYNWTLDGVELFPDECFVAEREALRDGEQWVRSQLVVDGP